MTTIKDNAGRPLYHYKHDGTYWDIEGNEITELDAMGFTYDRQPNKQAKHTPLLIPYIAIWIIAMGVYLIIKR